MSHDTCSVCIASIHIYIWVMKWLYESRTILVTNWIYESRHLFYMHRKYIRIHMSHEVTIWVTNDASHELCESRSTACCIWSVISSISNLNRLSRSLGLFCHVPLKRNLFDWDGRLRYDAILHIQLAVCDVTLWMWCWVRCGTWYPAKWAYVSEKCANSHIAKWATFWVTFWVHPTKCKGPFASCRMRVGTFC